LPSLSYGEKSFKNIFIEIKQKVTNTEFPKEVVTTRYIFDSKFDSNQTGPFYLEKLSGNELIGLNRNNGEIWRWLVEQKQVKEFFIGNLKIKNLLLDGNAPYSPPMFTDLLVVNNSIYASIIELNKAEKCQLLSLYKTSISNLNFMKKIYSTPCVKAFTPALWGGKLLKANDEIYMSVGEMRFDTSGYPFGNFNSVSYVSENKLNYSSLEPFGTVIFFNKKNEKDIKVFTSGHRNIQGLAYDKENDLIFATEHGPFGGDEINVLKVGNYYGWPFESFGKPYPENHPGDTPSESVDLEDERKGFVSGKHPNASIPFDSWSPGKGPSALQIVDSNSKLKDWRNDLIYSQMKDGKLVRLTLNKDKSKIMHREFISLERDNLTFRVRDFEVLDNVLALSLDNGKIVFYTRK